MSLPIVLVEDNPDDVTLTLRAFAKNGVENEILVRTDGEQLLAELLPAGGGSPLRPVFILMDIKLPKLSGLEILERIRADERTRGIPVIMLTTSREKHDIDRSYRLGANSFVCKPVAYDRFLETVRTLSEFWLKVNLPSPESTP